VAKLKAPLLSLGASGALGKTLVFFPWKGLDVAREYVVPANPKTAAQVTQRGYVTAAVAKIHVCQALAANALDEADISAYALLGSTHPTPRTWFNEIVKEWIDCELTSDIPVIYTDGTISTTTANAIDLIMYLNEKTASQLAAGKFYFGTSKTSLIHSMAATVVAGTSVALTAADCSAFLTAGNKYYVQFKPDAADPAENANSGIYHFVAS